MTDEPELERLVRTYEHTLYRAAAAILGDAHEAEDAVQDTFLAWLERPPVCPDGAHQRAWLLKVTVNGCKSRLRAPWRQRTAPLLDSFPAAAPEEQGVMEAMLRLRPKDRAAVHLFYYDGYQTGEIAAILGEREGTTRSRLSRARKKLKDFLAEEV